MKSLLRILVWIVGILVVLVVVAMIGLKLFFPAEKVKELAVARGSDMLGREIAVSGLDVSLWGGLGVKLQDVVIGNPPGVGGPPFLAAENIDLKLQLFPLLSGDLRVDRLIVEAPRICMLRTATGEVNYSFETADSIAPQEFDETLSPEARAAAATVSFEALEIIGGHLSYRDDSSGMLLELADLDLSTSLENPREAFYASSGKIRVGSLKVTADQSYPTVTLALSYRIGLDLPQKLVTIEKADFGINGLRFKLSGELTDPLGNLSARGNVKSDRITVTDLLELLPGQKMGAAEDFSVEGDFSLDADVEYNIADNAQELFYTGTASLTDLVMSKKGIDGQLRFRRCLVDFEPDKLRMNIEEGRFDGHPFKGHLVVDDFDDPAVSGELAGSFDLVYLEPFMPVEPQHKLTGQTVFDLKFSGRTSDAKNMSFSGNLTVKDGRYSSRLATEPIETLSLEAYFDNSLLHVREFACRFPSGHFGFEGRINDLVPYLIADSLEAGRISPSIEGALEGQVDLAMVNGYLPDKGNPALTGQLTLDVTFSGEAGDPTSFESRGTMSVSGASYTDSLLPEPIESFEVRLDLKPDTIAISNMHVKFTSSDVSFSGQLIRPFPYLLPSEGIDRSRMEKPLFVFALESHRFDTDKLFPEAVPGSAADPAARSADSMSMIILPDIDGRGTFKADTVIYSRVEFTELGGKIRINDRKIECYDATGKVYTGAASGRISIDLSDFSNPYYSGEFSATQIEADDFINRFSKFGGHLYGKANISGTYQACGWESRIFLDSLKMDGRGEVREGKLVTSGAVYKLLNEIAQRVGQSFAEEQPVKGLTTNIAVADGRVKLNRMKATLGDIGDLEIDGYYGFDGGLDYKGTLELSKGTTEKLLSGGTVLAGMASLFTNKKSERVVLPLKMTGTVDNPKADVDYTAISKNVGDNLKEDATSLLEGLFKKKKK